MMTNTDERFKDASPENTVERIQSILASNGLEVEETWHETGLKNCHALTLTIKGTTLFSNGKGVTKVLARASGYAELMERLQSGHLGLGETEFADSVTLTKKELIEYCGGYLEQVAKAHPKSDGTYQTVEQLAELCLLMDNGETVQAVPFYDVTDNKMTYYPKAFMKVYSANGMAAGNTVEEAMVQSFSEIFERNCMLNILQNSIVPPSVPEEYLMQFPRAYETIKSVREAGYDIYVKDCSLESPFPVLAAVLIDKRTHCYHVHMGSHPIFEIALGRTLTESFQGRNLENVTTVSELTPAKAYKSTSTNLEKSLTRSIGTYPTEFFGNKHAYEFKPFPSRTDKTNKELLKEITEFINARGYKMLVRDHSSLGFNTFRIVIPGMSETKLNFLDEGVTLYTMMHFHDAYTEKYTEITPEHASLRVYLESYMLNVTLSAQLSKRFFAPLAIPQKDSQALFYLNMAYLEWTAKHKEKAISCLANAHTVNPGYDADYLHCLQSYLHFKKSGCTDEEIWENLAPFYFEDILSELKSAIESGNPFRKYAYDCGEEFCDTCKYKNVCLGKSHREVKNKINNALAKFDNDTAFENLRKTFSNL